METKRLMLAAGFSHFTKVRYQYYGVIYVQKYFRLKRKEHTHINNNNNSWHPHKHILKQSEKSKKK